MAANQKDLSDINQVIGANDGAGKRRYLNYAIAVVTVLAVFGLAVVFLRAGDSKVVRYATAPVTRGDLTVAVTATGTVQPVNQVDVGTEISGTIRTVEADYNDRVKVGQVLARIDTEKLQAQVSQSQSTLESVQAKLADAQATVVEAHDNLERFKQVREMSGGKVPSQREFDGAEARPRSS